METLIMLIESKPFTYGFDIPKAPGEVRCAGVASHLTRRLVMTDTQRVQLHKKLLANVLFNPHTGCWEWTGTKTHQDYGVLGILGVRKRAHRAAFEAWIGELGPGEYVCHTCDNASCINPGHLWPGSAKDNIEDCKAKDRLRSSRGPAHGHAKLDWQAVDDIRSRVANGEKHIRLAEEYGVHRSQITYIVHGKFWKEENRPK